MERRKRESVALEARRTSLGIRVRVDLSVVILFGLEVISPAIDFVGCIMEAAMENLIAKLVTVMAYVWCEVAFLRGLVKLQPKQEVNALGNTMLAKSERRRFDSSTPHQINRVGANRAFKPLAMLAGTSSTPRLFAHGFAIVAQTALRTGRRLTGR